LRCWHVEASYSTSHIGTCGQRHIPAAYCGTAFPKNGAAARPNYFSIRMKKRIAIAARTKRDFDTAAVIAGEVVDLITDIPPASEIVQRMVKEAAGLLSTASNRYRLVQ
jgi:hypothetical protein